MPASKTISVLIIDDSELVRIGIKALFEMHNEEEEPKLRVVGEITKIALAPAEAARLKPAVILLDLRLPDGSGLSACRQLLTNAPETKILILSALADNNLVYEALGNGAHGYLLKDIAGRALCRAIIDVTTGKFILDPALTANALNFVRAGAGAPEKNKLAILSAQQRRVLAQVAEGKTNKEIAEHMKLSDKTVKNYLSNIFEKLQISRRSQAAVLFLESRHHP